MWQCPICSNQVNNQDICQKCGYDVRGDFLRARTLCSVSDRDVYEFHKQIRYGFCLDISYYHVLFQDISYEIYERLLDMHGDCVMLNDGNFYHMECVGDINTLDKEFNNKLIKCEIYMMPEYFVKPGECSEN